MNDAEEERFGRRFSASERDEMKARTLLKPKTFRLAAQMPPIATDERRWLVSELLARPEEPSRARLTALGQAKVAFVERVLELCATHAVRFFASIVPARAPRPPAEALRKDYAYLFEGFFYFGDELPPHERGLVVFDELDRTQSHILLGQMASYFRETQVGQRRSSRIIPEPFFVHSDLTTGEQIVDLVAYIIAWNVRFREMRRVPRREELNGLGQRVRQLGYRGTPRPGFPGGLQVWPFFLIDDLHTRQQQGRGAW